MTAKQLLQGQRIVNPDGTPTQAFLEIMQGVVGGVNAPIAGLTLANFAAGVVQTAVTDTDTAFPTSGAVLDALAGTTAGPTATTSGTAVDFTGIPAGVTEIALHFDGVSLSGTDNLLVQLGDAGGVETTGYQSFSGAVSGTSAAASTSTSGFIVRSAGASRTVSGLMTLRRGGGNAWSAVHGVYLDSTTGASGGGRKALSDVLTQVRVTVTGANTFDAGAVTLRYR